jgi:glycosyltransferase involved in cell wall biosynthesis
MPTDKPKPLASVGVFLRNEGPYVRQSLQSLRAQDYGNVEIIVSDNCSTDDTDTICRDIAAADNRVVYEQQETNIGAAANSIRVLDRANGEYFMWASGHDLWAPDLVSKCVAALESHPGSALAYASLLWIDADGNALDKESGWYDTRGMDSIGRFFMAFWGNLHPVLGVIRTEYLRNLPKIHACAGSDQIVLTELALRGDFIHVPDTFLSRRTPRGNENHNEKIKRYTSDEFGLAGSWLDRRLPLVRIPLEMQRAIYRSRLSIFEKLAMTVGLLPAFVLRYLAGRKP